MATDSITREMLLDSEGRPLTQSLFLEVGYNEKAIYTFKEVDHVYQGKTYISLKKRFIEMEDPTEYEFATTYFLSWKHWLRICENKLLRAQIDEWREELEMKLRSRAVKQAMQAAGSPSGNFQASKWLVDKGWDPKRAGRPSKDELERESRIREKIDDEYSGDIARLK